MTHHHPGRTFTILTALLLTMAACTTKDDTMPTTPTAALADTQNQVQSRLDAITSALKTAAPTAQHNPANTKIGPMPCGDHGPDYQVTATDSVLLDGPHHKATLAALRDQLTLAGYNAITTKDFTDGIGGELDLKDPTGYTATISSGKDNHGLAIIVASPCFRTPDGTYPG